MTEKQSSLQERMRQDDKTALDFIYRAYKNGFINYASKYELSREDLEDVFQDAVIAVYQNFAIKKTVLKSSSLKTYLYGIGKNMIFTRFKKQIKTVEVIDDIITEEKLEDQEPTLEQHLLAKHFKSLSTSCQEILKLFYYRGLNVREIVTSTDYKDENTVKSHKSRCLKGLKEKIAKD
jgi:RNA polymerase sigma factor (sigma-70 family)